MQTNHGGSKGSGPRTLAASWTRVVVRETDNFHTDDFASDASFARDDEDKANTLIVKRNDITCCL